MREYDENVEDAEDEGGDRAAEAAFDAGQDHNNAAHQKEDAGPDTGEGLQQRSIPIDAFNID